MKYEILFEESFMDGEPSIAVRLMRNGFVVHVEDVEPTIREAFGRLFDIKEELDTWDVFDGGSD